MLVVSTNTYLKIINNFIINIIVTLKTFALLVIFLTEISAFGYPFLILFNITYFLGVTSTNLFDLFIAFLINYYMNSLSVI